MKNIKSVLLVFVSSTSFAGVSTGGGGTPPTIYSAGVFGGGGGNPPGRHDTGAVGGGRGTQPERTAGGSGSSGTPPAKTVEETITEIVQDIDLNELPFEDHRVLPVAQAKLDKLLEAVAKNGFKKPISGPIFKGDETSTFTLGDISVENGTMDVRIGHGLLKLKSDFSNPITE